MPHPSHKLPRDDLARLQLALASASDMGPHELLTLISGFRYALHLRSAQLPAANWRWALPHSALIAFKPSEPFLVSYMRCIKLIPSHYVIHEVFPVWTYAYLALLPCMSILAELIGYRLVVLIGVLGRIFTLFLMLSPVSNGSLFLMQLSQVTVAMGFAAHPSLSAIMFRKLPASAYARAAGVVASAAVLSEVRDASSPPFSPPPCAFATTASVCHARQGTNTAVAA